MSTAKYTHNPYHAKVLSAGSDATTTSQRSGLSDSSARTSRSVSPSTVHHFQQDVEEEGMGCRTTSAYHEALAPALPFFEYRTTAPMVCREAAAGMGLVRLFVGQVPYHLEAGHVAWMLGLLSQRRPLLVEKIVRWSQERRPCGCFHVYCRPADVSAMLAADQTALCEADGVWRANDDVERQVLVEHCRYLQANWRARAPLMPYQLVTVQVARSSYR